MINEDLTTRNNLLNITFGLLAAEDEDNITIRKIAHKAKVAVSAINYHFQTKENLINLAIENGIGSIVDGFVSVYQAQDGEPVDRLRLVLKMAAKYIADTPRVSKISMFNDLRRGYGQDNITQSTRSLEKILNEIFDGVQFPKKNEIVKKVISYQISSSIHFGFLRAEQLKSEAGLDFFDDNDRDIFIDMILDNLIH